MMRQRLGVVPFVLERSGRKTRLKVVLVSSRDGDRWVLPKGKPKARMSRRDLAALEAWEEAGVRGIWGKRRPIDTTLQQYGATLSLRLYPLEVRELAKRWPESDWKRRLVSPRRCGELLCDEGRIWAVRVLERRLGV